MANLGKSVKDAVDSPRKVAHRPGMVLYCRIES